MRKSNLLIKTWAITISILTMIMAIIYFYLYFSSVNHEVVSYNDDFNYVFNELTTSIEQNGIDNEELLAILPNGRYHAVIFDEDDTPIFPIETGYNVYADGELIAEEMTSVVTGIGWDDAYFEKEKEAIVIHNNTEYKLNLIFFGEFNWLTFYNLFRKTFPVFFLGAMLISTLFAIFYNYYFHIKVKKLVDIMSEMKISKKRINYLKQNKNRNEFEILENQLYDMYNNLQDSMDQLEIEMQLREQLENNRLLFMRSATHELKTPLMVLSSSIEHLLDHTFTKQQREEQLLLCYGQVQKFTNLVYEILELSCLENAAMTTTANVNVVIQEIMESYSFLLENKGLTFKIFVEDELTLKFSQKHFYKILSNLTSNAIKFTPKNGKISLYITENKLIMKNDIYDNQVYDNIMEAFVTHDHEGGHGLGLYFIAYLSKYYEMKYNYEYDLENQKFIFELKWK